MNYYPLHCSWHAVILMIIKTSISVSDILSSLGTEGVCTGGANAWVGSFTISVP